MNPRHATANTTTKYIAVKMPTLMRSFPVSLPPVFDVEADAFPVVFMCESFPVRLFSRRAFYEVSHIQQYSILANTHRVATPKSRACSKRPHVLQDGRVRFATARDGAATAWESSRRHGKAGGLTQPLFAQIRRRAAGADLLQVPLAHERSRRVFDSGKRRFESQDGVSRRAAGRRKATPLTPNSRSFACKGLYERQVFRYVSYDCGAGVH